MPTPRSAYLWLDVGLQGASTATKEVLCPWAGTIKEVWVGAAVAMTTGTLAIAKDGVNILTASTVDMSTDLLPATSQTLATGTKTLRVTAGQIIKATWTVTSAGSFVGGSCLVGIEPDVW